MRPHLLRREQWLPRDLEATFAFFADAANLEAITPPFLHFSILTPRPIAMREGALLEYRLRLFGAPLRWRTRIAAWEPPHAFVDEQIAGPYALWVHRHEFAPRDGGTRVTDEVRYRLPLAPLAAPVHAWFVRPALERIFDFRRDAMARWAGAPG